MGDGNVHADSKMAIAALAETSALHRDFTSPVTQAPQANNNHCTVGEKWLDTTREGPRGETLIWPNGVKS